MESSTIHSHLRRAAAAIESAHGEALPGDAASYLAGAMDLLTHHSDGGATAAEAMLYPSPGALDTMQRRLSEIIAEVDDPAAESLRTARAQILQAILLLDEQQREGRPTSSWR